MTAKTGYLMRKSVSFVLIFSMLASYGCKSREFHQNATSQADSVIVERLRQMLVPVTFSHYMALVVAFGGTAGLTIAAANTISQVQLPPEEMHLVTASAQSEFQMQKFDPAVSPSEAVVRRKGGELQIGTSDGKNVAARYSPQEGTLTYKDMLYTLTKTDRPGPNLRVFHWKSSNGEKFTFRVEPTNAQGTKVSFRDPLNIQAFHVSIDSPRKTMQGKLRFLKNTETGNVGLQSEFNGEQSTSDAIKYFLLMFSALYVGGRSIIDLSKVVKFEDQYETVFSLCLDAITAVMDQNPGATYTDVLDKWKLKIEQMRAEDKRQNKNHNPEVWNLVFLNLQSMFTSSRAEAARSAQTMTQPTNLRYFADSDFKDCDEQKYKTVYKEKARSLHPDVGGKDEDMKALNREKDKIDAWCAAQRMAR